MAAAGVAAIIDAVVIIARVKIIVAAAVMTYLLFLLLRCIITVPSTNTMHKRIPLIERQGGKWKRRTKIGCCRVQIILLSTFSDFVFNKITI